MSRHYGRFRAALLAGHHLTGVKAYKILRWHHGTYNFTANGENRNIFIKTDFELGLLQNELIAYDTLAASETINTHLLEPIFISRGEYHYIGYELLDAINLMDYLSKHNISQARLDQIHAQLLAILDGLYEAAIVHRDISLQNLLVLPSGQIKLIDFTFCQSVQDQTLFKDLDPASCLNKKILGSLGEAGQITPCVWDDAYAFSRLAAPIRQMTGLHMNTAEFDNRVGRLQYRLLQ